jgi:hypothetical protein
MLFEQTCVASQTLLQPPQLAALVVTSTQFAPHTIWPAVGQPQEPLVHAWPAGHWWPQEPQFRASFPLTFTHAPEQFISPDEHVEAHDRWLQTWPPEQALVQVPQWAGSEASETHAVPHAVRPARH